MTKHIGLLAAKSAAKKRDFHHCDVNGKVNWRFRLSDV
jgi:hypothetical protein